MGCSEMTVSSLSSGQMPPSLPAATTALSRADCVSLCFFSAYCTTMFYNKEAKSCHLMEGFKQTQLVATSEPIEHLVLGKAHCPLEPGYLFSRRLNMCYKKHADLTVWTDDHVSVLHKSFHCSLCVPAPCPLESGYLYSRRLNMCYKKHTYPKVWTDAKTACSAVGSYLVIINSAERNQFMYDIAADIGPFWTSGNILESSWRWGDNSSIVEPTFWNPGEPNYLEAEKCLTFWNPSLPTSWYNGACSHPLPFVCELAM